MVESFDSSHEITEFAYAVINPAIFDGLPKTTLGSN